MPVYASGLGVVLKPSSLNETFNSRQRLDHAKNIIVDMDKPTRTASGNTPQVINNATGAFLYFTHRIFFLLVVLLLLCHSGSTPQSFF